MARIRTIKPEICTSAQFVECSPNARLLFVLMLCFFDDNGNHPANGKRLKMEVFPADNYSMEEMGAMMDELIGQGLVVEYVHGGELYWHITGFARHQRVDRPNPKYPAFDERAVTSRRAVAEHSPPEGKGEDRKGGEGKVPVTRAEPGARDPFPVPARRFREPQPAARAAPVDARRLEHERIMAANAAACRRFCGEGP